MSKKSNKVVFTSTNGKPKWSQSPIDLSPMYTLTFRFPPLFLEGHLGCKGSATMTNTGTTAKIEFGDVKEGKMWGGPLSDLYKFTDAQFRWGPTNAFGAEHTVNGTRFSMEAQVIHWNTSYGSIDKCYDKPDGFAILSFLFQVIGCPNTAPNPNLEEITDNLAHIKIPDKKTSIRTDCLKWMLEAFAKPGYYTYSGSLTTPPFAECVTWIVIPRPIVISARQVEAFRSLYNHKIEHIASNFRPVQKICNRKIYYGFQC